MCGAEMYGSEGACEPCWSSKLLSKTEEFWGPERKLGVVGQQKWGVGVGWKIGRVEGWTESNWLDFPTLEELWTSQDLRDMMHQDFLRASRTYLSQCQIRTELVSGHFPYRAGTDHTLNLQRPKNLCKLPTIQTFISYFQFWCICFLM